MKVALVNPRWNYGHSIYFGCREPHLPLELGYARLLLEQRGHEALLCDAHGLGLDHETTAEIVSGFRPAMTVVTTAPTYLFWRCAPPELRVPREFLDVLGDAGGTRVVVGPHGSATPTAALRKLGADVVVRGECEEAIVELAERPVETVSGVTFARDGEVVSVGNARAARFSDLPPLRWEKRLLGRHSHHHHRFDTPFSGLGAEVEASRGCPYSCTFCAKIDYRDKYRRRHLSHVAAEIDGLAEAGVKYVYFIDEIFLPDRALLEALGRREIKYGIQTRIDLWKPEMLDLLGRSGCVSIEAGVESLTVAGREALDKKCRLDTEQLTARLIRARETVPFVQANLIATAGDDVEAVARWRERLRSSGVWANDPVPLYPYPSSPDYRRLFGLPDDEAWERAHGHYLAHFDQMSELQDEQPWPLQRLEAACRHA